MAKLTPIKPRQHTSHDPIHLQLGPPAEAFTLCEQEFTIKISEFMWPGHVPYTEAQIRTWIAKGLNPRMPHIFEVQENEIK